MDQYYCYPNPSSSDGGHQFADHHQNHHHQIAIGSSFMDFDALSDYLMVDHRAPDFVDPQDSLPQQLLSTPAAADCTIIMEGEMKKKKTKKEELSAGGEVSQSCRVAFRTKSEVEIMDDGFKWRKYGKKSVKNSPNPRNYYKCSNGGCDVKKRVERDRDDGSYVITTYDGVHNHHTPNNIDISSLAAQLHFNPKNNNNSNNSWTTLQTATSSQSNSASS